MKLIRKLSLEQAKSLASYFIGLYLQIGEDYPVDSWVSISQDWELNMWLKETDELDNNGDYVFVPMASIYPAKGREVDYNTYYSVEIPEDK